MKPQGKKLPRRVEIPNQDKAWIGGSAWQRGYAAGWADAQESRNQDDIAQLSDMAADLLREKR